MSRLLNMLRELSFSNNEKFPVTESMRKDLLWWQKFLPLYNGVSIIKNGTWLPADSFFFIDACLSGFGAVCRDKYIRSEWPEEIKQLDLHISARELFTIVITVKVWGKELSGLCMVIACDNEPASIAINSGKSEDNFMQQCLRELWFIAAVHEFEIRVSHIPGREDFVADWLSRWLFPACRSKFKRYNSSLETPLQCRAVDSSNFSFVCD